MSKLQVKQIERISDEEFNKLNESEQVEYNKNLKIAQRSLDMNLTKFIIGITGKRGVGKSTAAKYLTGSANRFVELSFADPLKKACSALLGVEEKWFYDQNLKEKVIPFWGQTPRYFMQKFGTEVFRDFVPTITPEVNSLWIQLMEKQINESDDHLFVISDVRFDDEAKLLIEKYNGMMVEIQGPNRISNSDNSASSHSSEHGIDPALIGQIILNDKLDSIYISEQIQKCCNHPGFISLYMKCRKLQMEKNSSQFSLVPSPVVQSFSPVVQASATIGQKGEQYVLDIIKGAYPEVETENISSKSRAGDILFKPHLQSVGYNAQVMFEVKKYSRKVPSAEYEKFLRDIQESNHDGGVFISLSSDITGVTDSIVIKTINTERDGTLVPVIIASTDDKYIIKSLISLVVGYITLIRKQGSFVNKTDFTVQIIQSLQRSLNAYNNIRSNVRELRASNDKLLGNIQDSLTSNYSEIRTLLNQLQGFITVVGGSDEHQSASVVGGGECNEPSSSVVDTTHGFQYPKIIDNFILLFNEKKCYDNWQIIYHSEKKIIIIPTNKDTLIYGPDFSIELNILKSKSTCIMGPFDSQENLFNKMDEICVVLFSEKDNGDEYLTGSKTNPFTNYTYSNKKLKFDMECKYLDIVIGFLWIDIDININTEQIRILKNKKS